MESLLLVTAEKNNLQELAPLKAGSEYVQTFKNAVLQPVKLKNNTFEEVKDVLKYCMLVVGLRAHTISLFEDEEKAFLVHFIQENYGQHTIAEVKLAFDKAVRGELDLKDIKTYENFSTAYFAMIMNAYRRWAGDFYRETGIERELINHETSKKLLPPAKWDPKDWADEFYQDFLAGKLNINLVPERIWELVEGIFHVQVEWRRKVGILEAARAFVLSEYKTSLNRLKIENAGIGRDLMAKSGEYRKIEKLANQLKAYELLDSCNDVYVNRFCKAFTLREWFQELQIAGIKTLKDPQLIIREHLKDRTNLLGFLSLRAAKPKKSFAPADAVGDYSKIAV